MTNVSEITYWISLAHLPRWGNEKINKLIVDILHINKQNLEDFFTLKESDWKQLYNLNDKQISDLDKSKKELPNNSFLAEDLLSQGFDIIPINSPEYSPTLKNNLKAKLSPPVLYVKGNKNLLKENSIAIVGSRDASDKSLEFTDNIAKEASKQFKVVVSGFAKGVDKQALDSAIKYVGQSIIVLPQGILTFSSGIKKYYKQIVDGNVLVLSTYHPKAVWSVGMAMGRNPIIYGLAKEIFVAQSSNKGGTWEGVKSGLKMGRTIYVRKPDDNENNSNNELIQLGALSVDFKGNLIENNIVLDNKEKVEAEKESEGKNDLSTIINTLKGNNEGLTTAEIKKKSALQISTQKIASLIKGTDEILKLRGKPAKYILAKQKQANSLFSLDEDKIPGMTIKEDNQIRMQSAELKILSLSFVPDEEWKFNYNNKIITAKIIDQSFNNKINEGISNFKNNDKLKVELKIIEYSGQIFKYEISKVISHESPLNTSDLNLTD